MKQAFYIFLSICCFSCMQLSAQGTGTWKSYMAYYKTVAVAEAENNVYAVANSSLYSYSKEDGSYRTYSKEGNGLSDTQIDTIAYNPNIKALLIVYTNGNIDILNEKGISNIPFLMLTTLPDKTIHHIYFQDKYAYISAEFGIMVLNMEAREVTDTYPIGSAVYSTCIYKDHIYAATSDGIRYSRINNNLLDPNSWQPYSIGFTDQNDSAVTRITVFQDRLVVLAFKQGIYHQQSGTTFQPLYIHNELRELSVQNNKLISFTDKQAQVWFSFTEKHTLPTGTLHGISSLKENNTYWVASDNQMLRGLRRKGNTSEYEWFVHGIHIDSPKHDYADFMTFRNGKLYVAGGGRWTDAFKRPGAIMVYDRNSENDKWYNFDEAKVISQSPGNSFNDVTSIAIDPQDPDRLFASTWGAGLFEFKNNEFVKQYYTGNSTLESIEKKEYDYIRVEGLCFDKDNNLWMTNSGVKDGIKIMNKDGKWRSLYFPDLRGQHVVDKILFTSANHKWVNVLRGTGTGSTGILVFDETSDKESQFYSTFRTNSTQDGVISATFYYCMAEDRDGHIWIGTNLGPIVCTNPTNALNNREAMRANRIIREDENGDPTLFMDGESVRAIAVDGGNRKWLGTQNTGVILVSPDGTETIEHFQTDNSPLPSNRIESIAIDPETGEVFIGTDKGLVSYMGSATEGRESYSDVYAYPNPVRPDYQGEVTITGLMTDTNIKITDINGNLIKQGTSFGGQYTWDCRKRNGERVATGIYLVLASEPRKGESVVTKIMVVK